MSQETTRARPTRRPLAPHVVISLLAAIGAARTARADDEPTPPPAAAPAGEPDPLADDDVTSLLTAGAAPAATPAAPGDSVYSDELLATLGLDSSELVFDIHGFINLEYSAFRDDPEHPRNTFDIHNVFLSTRAHIDRRINAFVELEYEHGAALKVDRAFVDIALADAVNLRLGRFSAPLSYERVHYAAPVRLMTSRPRMVDIGFHEWVDTGIALFGRRGAVGYNLAVVNGPRGLTEAGVPNQDVVDNNGNKTVIARLSFYPGPELELGVVAAAGTYDPADRRWFYLGEVDARLRHRAWDVWAEAQYRDGDDEPCDPAADAACSVEYAGERAHKLGYYVLVGYTAVQDRPHVHYLKPVVRYDELDDLTLDTSTRRITAGVDWSPRPHVVFKSELQATLATADTEGSGGLMMSAVADF